MALESFQPNTFIIPMDTTYQNNGMFKAYGLVYNLLLNNIPVKWSIKPNKSFNATDFTASSIDLQSGTPIVNHNYSGGPFIIDSAFYTQALPFISAWQSSFPNVKVHVAASPFQADIASTMTRVPRIAVEALNSSIIINYLNVASIPDSNGDLWSSSSPGVLSESEIAQGALFGYSLSQCRRIAYDIFLSPHTGTSTWDDPDFKIELNDYLKQGGYLHATCESIPSIENTAGPFLTVAGIPTSDKNGGDTSSFVVSMADFPSAQAVSTGLPQGLPGGSFQTVYHLSPGLIFNPQTQIIAYFTEKGKQYDFMIAGPYKNGEGAGKIIYEGGHNYNPKLPYTSQMENLYYRFILNSIFFSISKPLMFLEYSPATLFKNIINTITFSIVNTGASPATDISFSVTLAPGISYNGDATIPPTSIVGQTLTWNSSSLGDVYPGVALTFTANFIPTALGITKLADFSSSFGDIFQENFSLTHCVTATVESFDIADLSIMKTVDKSFATFNDILNYEIKITNVGTITANNVVLIDTIPTGSTFIPGSITVNGIPVSGDLNLGIPLSNIPPNNTTIVKFQVTVNDTENPIDIINQASVNYKFTNNTGTFDSISKSNIVTTQVKVGKLQTVKSANRTIATIDDSIMYTIVITNTGNVTVNNVIFTDNIPNGTIFDVGSVTVDGNAVSGNPITGIPLGNIPAGSQKTITFRVIVTSIPTPPTAINTATVNFTYKINPQEPDIEDLSKSNPVIVQLITTSLNVIKSADKSFANLGDTITYTITVTNTGNIIANDVILIDLVPNGTIFVPNSVTINENPTSYNPNIGIPLSDINVGETSTIVFKVTATSVPIPNPTINIATATALFTTSPNEPPKILEFNSNPISVKIEDTKLDVVKNVDKSFAEVGDILTYTVSINNVGTVSANNVIFKDTLPNVVNLVPNSLTLNGVPISGNISTGINIGNINSGEVALITFKVNIVSIPTTNPITNIAIVDAKFPIDPNKPPVDKSFSSNPVDTNVIEAKIVLLKSVDKNVALVGDTLTYTINIKNTGNINVIATLYDLLPNGALFIPNSLKINGISIPGANPNNGVDIGNINIGETIEVIFNVKVNSRPEPPILINKATVEFQYILDPTKPPQSKTKESNQVITHIEVVDLELIKTVDKNFVIKGDILTYTVIVKNKSSIALNNVIFKDPIPLGTTFVENSFTINGVSVPSVNPQDGINIGTLNPNESIIVSFSVKFEYLPCIPIIRNIAFAEFKYKITQSGEIQSGNVESNQTETQAAPTNFKQISVDENISIPIEKPDAEDILNVIVDVEIIDTNVIKTVKGTSQEGQTLTGYKLIVNGILYQKIEYISDLPEQTVHTAEFEIPFSTFIILPENFVEGTNINVKTYVEDVYVKLLDKRNIFKNVTLRLEAEIAY